ncbi:hypothetical protein DVH24_022766 [Malus domestica]|uniref:Pectinesterase n=1 Tax=Malus domestica TaxID=3750 RepID=A0A498KSH8_MALDO|nr:hypothetical protein DVH24_022766 [Malus domestica]
MAGKTACMFIHASLMIITILLTSSTAAIADDTIPIPSDSSQVASWFDNNVKTYNERKSTLDPALVAAEHAPQVMQDGGGNFKTVTDAINSIPARNTKRVFVYIKGRVMPNITFDGTTQKYGTVYSGTLIVESNYFRVVNLVIIVRNSPRRVLYKGTLKSEAFRRLFVTSCFPQFSAGADIRTHFMITRGCICSKTASLIQGSVDFIFGKGKSLYLCDNLVQNTEMHVVKRNLTVITAQQRDSPSEDSGFSFVHCKITGTTYARRTYLGRAWGSSPNVVVACTDIAILSTLNVNRKQILSHCFAQLFLNNLFYGEYNNWGQGSNITSKARYTRKLSDAETKPFISLGNIQGSKWLLPQ